MTQPTEITCGVLPAFDESDWHALTSAFASAPAVELDQSWLASREPGFRPGVVRIGQHRRALWLLAELHDDDIFNPEQRFNEPFFLRGDTFEVFLKPESQLPYYEFHIGPDNQRMQLRIPSAQAFTTAPDDDLNAWKLPADLFRSWTRVEADRHLWTVAMEIPLQSVVEPGGSCESWLFSCSRYDYTHGASKPVLSSTSTHRRLDFHHQEDWRRLRFAP